MPELADVLRCALRAAGLGWPVFPLVRGGKTPAIRAAHPAGDPCRGECGRYGHGFHDATTDPDVIAAWWASMPAANYGIATGPAGLVVVDLDTGKEPLRDGRVLPDQGQGEPTPADVRAGVDVLTWAAQRDGAGPGWLETFTVATPSGGWHLYYAAPAGLQVRGSVGSSAGRLTGAGWCVDVRAWGGYVVGPGCAGRSLSAASTQHAHPARAAHAYRVVENTAPATVPGWLLNRIQQTGPHGMTAKKGPCIGGDRGREPGRAGAPPGQRGRPSSVRPGYAAAAIAGELAAIGAATPHAAGGGGRNATVNRAAYKLGRLVAALALDVDEVCTQLLAAATATGLSPRESAAAIASGLAQGQASPRPITSTTSPTGTTEGRP